MAQKKQIKKTEEVKKPLLIKESYFIKSFRLAKANPNKIGLIILFDVMFVIAAFSLNKILQFFSESIFISQPLWSIAAFITLSLLYYLLMILAYSFFKYLVLDYTKTLFEKSAFSFSRLAQFYKLNVVIAGILFAAIVLFELILKYLQPQYRPWVFIAVAVPFLVLLYVLVNSAHSSFYNGSSIKQSINYGFRVTFTKLKAYRETILIMIFFALLLWLLFLGAGYLVRLLSSKNYSMYLSIYSYYKQITIMIFDIIFYLVILINRITFYAIIKEKSIQ